MLDVLEVAKEKGIEEGKTLGIGIARIKNQDTVESLFRQVFRCDDMTAFEKVLERSE